jgi:hypothetical protein
MKKLMMVLAATLFLLACMKEQGSGLLQQKNQPVSNDLEKNMVTRPMHVNFYATPDMTVAPVQCFPTQLGTFFVGGGMKIYGNATHVGLVNADESFGRTQQCMFGPAQFQLTTRNVGQIAAANGDLMYFSSEDVTNVIDGSFTGVVTLSGGTGRFTGSTGSVNITGTVNFQTGFIQWTGTGTITY